MVLLPQGWTAADGPLPVLMEPYGGPHHAEVGYAARTYLGVPVDRRPGLRRGRRRRTGHPRHRRPGSARCASTSRPPRWRARWRRCRRRPAANPSALDLSRVAIRGWSFGGYLAALAVLRRPDVFHAAVAGAPVTDWLLYDTAYTERYLGLPGRAARRLCRQLAARATPHLLAARC